MILPHENKNNNNFIIIKERKLRSVLRLYISVALQQKTANFKVAIQSRPNQWSDLPEGKQKNELAA